MTKDYKKMSYEEFKEKGMTPSDYGHGIGRMTVLGIGTFLETYYGSRGSNTGSVAAGDTVQFVTRPQIKFRPERFHVWKQCADSFLIRDIKVGCLSNFVNGEPVPADMFAIEFGPNGPERGERFECPVVQASQDLMVTVTNIGDRCLPFYAAFIGRQFLEQEVVKS